MSIEQYDLRVLIRHYWRNGLTVLKAVDEINEAEGAGTANFEQTSNFQQIRNLAEGWQTLVDYDGLYFER